MPGSVIVDGWNAFWDGGFGGEDGNTWIPDLNVDKVSAEPVGVPDIFKPPVPVVTNPIYGPENNPNPIIPHYSTDYGIATTTPYVSTPRDGTAITERPWKDEEIDVHAVGTHNSYDRGYDNVGNLKEGWALGIDDIPYNTALFALNDAAIADAAAGGGGGGYGGGGGSSPSAPVLNTRMPLNRIPSGSIYAPDLSAYNDSSLFNYTGPGGASEYTYGQNLPYQGAGYGLWGSPTDVANPYFWGQFANTATTGAATGPADAAINMPAVEMPAGVPSTNTTSSVPNTNNIFSVPNTNNIFSGGNNTGGGHNYWSEDNQRVYEMMQQRKLDGSNDKLIEEQILNDNAIKQSLAPPPIIDKGGVHYTGPLPPTAEQMRALSDINYGKTPYVSPGNPHPETLRTIDRQRLEYGQPLEWVDMGNNPQHRTAYPGKPENALPVEYNPYEGGEFSARQHYLAGPYDADNYSIWNNEYDLGRPGDPSYEEFEANPELFTTYEPPVETDYGVLAQAEADRLMANLTKEELRDGLFIEPDFKVVDGELVGRMGIPDIFTQDKSPIEPRSTLFDDPFGEFDPDNPYREPDRGDNFVWQDNFGDYHQSWDNMGLETYIPGSYDEDFMSGKSATEAQSLFDNAQAVENAKAAEATRLRDIKAQEEQAKYIKDQMEARDAVLKAQAEARAQAAQAQAVAAKQAQAQAAALAQAQAAAQAQAQAEEEARAQVAAQVEERTQVREQARQPVYIPPVYIPPVQSSMGSGSNWKPSWTGGF